MDNLLGASDSAGNSAGTGAGAGAKTTRGRPRGGGGCGRGDDLSDYEKARAGKIALNAVLLSNCGITTATPRGRGGGIGSRGGGGGRGGASAGASASKRKAPASNSYSVGDEVLARYRGNANGNWHAATIVHFMHPDRYVIEWEDGDDTDMVKCENDLKPLV